MSESLSSIDDLLARLVADEVPVERTGDDRVAFPLMAGDVESTAMIVWPTEVALVQVYLSLPFAVLEDHRDALCEGCVRLNHLLVMPGFGVDLDRGLPYFRVVHPRDPQEGMSVDDVHRMVQAAGSTVGRFGPVLELVASGQLAPEQLEQALA